MTHFALSDDQVMDLVERSMVVEEKNAHARMKRGLSGLATIASTSCFVGLLGTVIGIIDTISRGYDMEKMALLALQTAGISESLITTALGLLVAVPAAWAYNHFSSRLETFDIEIASAALELKTRFRILLAKRRLPA
jgi:biopolymer transport protein ExbB/biopolymer transport protein TolQ